MVEQLEQPQHAGAVARQVVGVVHHDVDFARAAAAQEAVELRDARGRVQPQGLEVGIEQANLAHGLHQQPIHRLLEVRLAFEPLVVRFWFFFSIP